MNSLLTKPARSLSRLISHQRFILLLAVVLGLALFVFTSPAIAGLQVGPAIIDAVVPHEGIYQNSIAVTNTSNAPTDIQVEIKGYGQGLNGST